MKKQIGRIAASFAAMCLWFLSMPFGVYADIIFEPPAPEPSSSSNTVLIIAGILVACVIIASVLIIKKIKK